MRSALPIIQLKTMNIVQEGFTVFLVTGYNSLLSHQSLLDNTQVGLFSMPKRATHADARGLNPIIGCCY